MKSEEDVYKEVQDYINSENHKRPCTLSTIKKNLRTQKIVDLIFSNPNIFKLEKEMEFVPPECRTEDVLLRYVMSDPERINYLTEEEKTIPILIGFEISKRIYEEMSARWFGQWRETFEYKGKSAEYRNDITAICDELSPKFKDKKSIEEMIDVIKEYCNSRQIELKAQEKYTCKYGNVNFDTGKRLFILVSGMPDSGKTYFSNYLVNDVDNSICFDSDMLLERNLLDARLTDLIEDKYSVVIFSDLYADSFFSKKDIGDSNVVNILMKPISIEEMHRNSKYMRQIPFDEYKKCEIDRFNYEGRLDNPIIVTNDYTKNTLCKELDKVKLEIAKRLGIELTPIEDEPKAKTLVESLRYEVTQEQKDEYNQKVKESNKKENKETKQSEYLIF